MAILKGILSSSIQYKKALKVVLLICLTLPLSLVIFYWCHTTNSLALTAFGYLTFFNVGSLATSLIGIWTSKQQPTPKFSFGFDRVNVLAVFSITVLLMMFGLNLIKHSMVRVFAPPVVSTENMLVALVMGVTVHLIIFCGVTNMPLLHGSEAASRNWMQRALNDLGHTVSAISPSVGRILLSRLNPVTLLVIGGAISLAVTQLLIDLDQLYIADVSGALFISALICGTMLPLSVYSAKILLQTAPQHILPLLDKSLREGSTLDGVLGMKNEHFWSITFGVYAGSLHVRVRRDANEQKVLTQLTSRLASQLNDLTIQVVKEDWTLASSPLTPSPNTPFPSPEIVTSHHGPPLPNPATIPITPTQKHELPAAQKVSSEMTLPSQVHAASGHTHHGSYPTVPLMEGHYSINLNPEPKHLATVNDTAQ